MSKIAMKSRKIRKKAIDKPNKTKYTENKNYNSIFLKFKIFKSKKSQNDKREKIKYGRRHENIK